MIRIAFSCIAAAAGSQRLRRGFDRQQRADIERRIKPVGEVCLEGDNSCGGAAGSGGQQRAALW